MKISKVIIDRKFEALARALGVSTVAWERVGGKNVAIPNAWTLDHVAGYGGYVIEAVCIDGKGVYHPFGSKRMKAAEFCVMVDGILSAIAGIKTGSFNIA